jgi:hypothetical protein
MGKDLADAFPGHERLKAVTAQRHDERRVEDLQLTFEVGAAGRHLIRLGVAIPGWPAFDDVGDEDLLALPAHEAEELFEEIAGGAHERPPLAILVLAGSLPDEDDLRVRVTFARDRKRALLGKPTASAGADLAGDGFESCPALFGGHATPTGRREGVASQSF